MKAAFDSSNQPNLFYFFYTLWVYYLVLCASMNANNYKHCGISLCIATVYEHLVLLDPGSGYEN